MTIRERLKSYKDKINDAKEFNNELKNLIGVELFDFIYSNDLLKTEFERRRYYLKNLADDKNFNSIQDSLFEVIQKILKLTSLKEVKERQKEWGNAVISKLKGVKGKEKNEDFLTLPEIYVALQDKNNYYRLSDNSYFSPLDGEISLENHIVPVKKQYEIIVEGFFREVFSSKLGDNSKKGLKLKELLNEYNDYWYKFDELIYAIPIKIHYKSFEKFFLDCIEFYPRKGHEFHYNFFNNAGSRQTETRFKEAKKNSIAVIDDLIDVAEMEEKQTLINSDPYINEAAKNTKIVADRLNETFLRDRNNIQISRAWFEALSNNAKPALEAYQTYVAQTLINFEPFRRTLEENARIINTVSKSIIMPNLEAIKPMLKELEITASKISELYRNEPIVITSPMPPRITEAIQTNRIVAEIRELKNKVEELTAVKTPSILQPSIEEKDLSKSSDILPKIFEINVKDREIWVNNFLIGKPHAVGNNFEFFDYVRQQPSNTKIEWRTIPDTAGWSMMKEAIKERRFIKILNALGFKGEIKKAFFYKVGKNTLHYKGDKVAKEDLEKAGVRFNLFIKELEVANAKIVPNSPV